MKLRAVNAQLCLTLWDPMVCSMPGSSGHGFSRQESWSGLPFPSLGDLPKPGIKSMSPASPALQVDSLPMNHWRSLLSEIVLPPHTIPLGCPSAPAPSIQYRASNLDWWLVPCMILYMFQCHSPKSSHPLPLPQSPKDIEWLFKSNKNFLKLKQ